MLYPAYHKALNVILNILKLASYRLLQRGSEKVKYLRIFEIENDLDLWINH